MALTTPTHQQVFNGQGSPTSECSSWPETAYSTRNSTKEEWLSMPVCANMREGPVSSNQGNL